MGKVAQSGQELCVNGFGLGTNPAEALTESPLPDGDKPKDYCADYFIRLS